MRAFGSFGGNRFGVNQSQNSLGSFTGQRSFVGSPSPTRRTRTFGLLDDVGDAKDDFVQQFGIQCHIPASYIEAALFYPKDPTVLVLLVNYLFDDDAMGNTDVDSNEKDSELDDMRTESMFSVRETIRVRKAKRGSAIVFL